jgi:tetratricopeptide (TPR) repeat protein
MHPGFPGNFYRPLFLLWLRLNYVLFGTNPWGWHLTTVLAHVGATLCVYFLAQKFLHDRVAALFASLIFGLHPIHIEGAAWVSGVPEPLLVVLVIPSYLCYLRTRDDRSRSRRWLAASLALYALAMLVKETALVLPLLILSSRWLALEPGEAGGSMQWLRPLPYGRGLHRFAASLQDTLPYIVMTIPYLMARFLALRGLHHPLAELPVVTIISTWPSLLWLYLRHLFWPVDLRAFYDLTYVEHPGLGNFVLPALLVALPGLLLAWWAKRSSQAALAATWLVLPILPALNVQVFENGQFAHDRYLYLPSVGFSILVALALRRFRAGRARLLGEPAPQVALVLVLACALGLSTTSQSIYYANHDIFYAHSYVGPSDNETVRTNLAGRLGEQGHYAEAAKIYQEVLERNPDSAMLNYDLGYADYLMGNLEDAEYYLHRAAELTSKASFLAACYFNLGLTQFKMGHFDDAALNLRRALAISPYTDNLHYALGMVLKMQHNLPGALAEFRAELALNPGQAQARRQIAEIENALQPGRTPDSGYTPGAP